MWTFHGHLLWGPSVQCVAPRGWEPQLQLNHRLFGSTQEWVSWYPWLVLCTTPSSASPTVSSGFKNLQSTRFKCCSVLPGLGVLSPSLKSMMSAGSSGSVPLQGDGITFAISEWFLYSVVAALCSVSQSWFKQGGCSIPWFRQMKAGFS